MPTYISLGKYTQQGFADIKHLKKNLAAVREAFRGTGVEIKEYYLSMGQYDFVAVIDAPDSETLAKFLMAVRINGNSVGETFRVFREDEYDGLLADLP
jgi:uncharacterized protein with GYD domain